MQQIINNGTVAGDGSGEILFSAFNKVNENFTELYADKLDNVVYINSPDDFPAAVGGVRELVPSAGAFVTYVIAPKTIDIGSDRFTITDGNVVIQGAHRTGSKIKNDSGTMFTCNDSFFFSNEIRYDTDDLWCDFTSDGSHSFVTNNVIIDNCSDIATIDGAFTSSFRTMTIINAGFGFTWSGLNNNQINISNMLAFSWSTTLLDLGTATFDIINIRNGNRFLSPSGTVILNGLANNGNLNAGGRGIVEGNLFNGVGTALNGIDSQDLQWDFDDNIFADNTTANTRAITDAFMLTAQTVTVSASGVYYPIGGANWQSDVTSRFTVGTDGLVTYNGLETIGVIVTSSATIEKVGGGSDFLSMQVAINGVVQSKSKGSTDNTSPAQVVSNGIFSLSTGDTIQLYVANEDSTSNIEVDQATMIIRKEI